MILLHAFLTGNRPLLRHEEGLSDQGGHHGTADDHGHQNAVLGLVDDVVGDAEEGRDGAEG